MSSKYTVVVLHTVGPLTISAGAVPPGTWFLGRTNGDSTCRLIFKPVNPGAPFQFFNEDGRLTYGSLEYAGEIKDYRPVDVEIHVKV